MSVKLLKFDKSEGKPDVPILTQSAQMQRTDNWVLFTSRHQAIKVDINIISSYNP